MLKQIDRIRCFNPSESYTIKGKVHIYYTSEVLDKTLDGEGQKRLFPSDAERIRAHQAEDYLGPLLRPSALQLAFASILELQPIKNIIVRRREVTVFLEGAFDWTKDLHVEIIGILLAAIYSGKEVEIQDATGFTPSQTVFVPAGALAEAVACLVIG